MGSNSQSISFAANQYITLGNTLQFDSNQSWSVASKIQLDAPPPGPSYWLPGGGASLVFGNTNGAPYQGYELWLDDTGDLRVRIMSNFLAGQYIDVAGSTNVADGKVHFIGATYDGSSTAAGVTLYVDGIRERSAVLSDSLVGSSASNGPMIIGNQLDGWQDQFQLDGDMASFALSDVVRDPSYFQPSSTIAPTYDSHTLVDLDFTTGSGLTVSDLSSYSNNGVLSDPTMWKSLRQIASVTIYDTTLSKAVTDTLSQPYTGPVPGIQTQFVDITTDSLNINATAPNCFIHTGSGNDAIALLSGTNVVDGGMGSNFLASGSGTDTFFLDARGATRDIWNTISKLHSGDAVTLWGISPSANVLSWSDGGGAAGYTGLTLHASAAGRPTASITLAGFTQADLTNGRLSAAFGHDAASNSDYLYLRAV